MLEEEVGVMRNAMTTRAPCGAKKGLFLQKCQCIELLTVFEVVNISPSLPHK